ncbi:MAG: DNA repair protein RadC [Lachnospiraceae bacterium]|nr:DNA repair protein RadC [Lachnospiraceae bacterium]
MVGEGKCDTILPYEKFTMYGPESLTDAELLAIIIRTGTKEKTALQIGEEILALKASQTGKNSILSLCELTLEELLKVDGIGEVKAVKLKCIAELSRRIWLTHNKDRLNFSKPSTIAAYYMENLRHAKKEQAILLSLNSKCELLKETMLSLGTVNMSLVSPRELFLQALKDEASNVILIHNHPSGDPTPSKADYELTKQLMAAGELLRIPLLDHIIIGDQCYTSFKESKCI